MGEPTIRPARDEDLAAILEIYNEQVLNGAATFDLEPRTMEAQREWMKQFTAPYVLLVAEEGGEIAAWGCLHPYGGKPGYRFTTEDSVYVRADRRANRLGRLMLSALVEAGGRNGFHAIIARIAGDNPASVRLHKSLGFVEIGYEREVGYKFERWLDVVVMERLLTAAHG
jgi:phosphinothricin acetyltransferase